MINEDIKQRMLQLLKQCKTHAELNVFSRLYRKRWYEIDKELLGQFKVGDIVKWYKGKKTKKVYWGVITEINPKARLAKAVSTTGSEWKLGGSVIIKVTEPERMKTIIEQLKQQGFKVEVRTHGIDRRQNNAKVPNRQ